VLAFAFGVSPVSAQTTPTVASQVIEQPQGSVRSQDDPQTTDPDGSSRPVQAVAASSESKPDHPDTHIFGVLPNYSMVVGTAVVPPVSVAKKFNMAYRNTFDPAVYPMVGVVAGFNLQYGSGRTGYLKQYVASLADYSVGNFLTSAILPSLLHQDPRYYERVSGGLFRRFTYAISRTLITRSDAGRAQFNFSEIGGNSIAAGLSNLYYPLSGRTVTGTLSRFASQVLTDALANELKEFWPDVRRKLHFH
jgi:hypothetical protein